MKNFIIDNTVDAIIGIDLNGQINYCNQAISQLLGYKPEQLVGTIYSKLLSDSSILTFDKVRESVLFNEIIEPLPSDCFTASKAVISVIIQYSPVSNEEGKIFGISAILRKVNSFEKAASNAQSLLETAPDAMVIVNQHGQIVLANAQTENLFGYVKTELLGREIEILIPEEYLKYHKQYRNKYINQPKTRSMGQNMELYGKRKDGSSFPVEVSLSPMKTEKGLFVSAAIRDITSRKKADKKFRGLLESAPDAIVIVGEGGKIQLVNTQVENIFGYTKQELLEKEIEILIPKRFHGSHLGNRDSFFANPKMRPMGSGMELLGQRKNGEEFPVEISLSPLETEDGMLVSAAIRDITERKAAEKELESFNKQLQIKNKELEQFAYVASHDLQEPLNTVTNLASLLSNNYSQNFDEVGQKSLSFISDAVSRMRELVRNLLDYSRIGQNRKLTNIDCTQLLQAIRADLAGSISESGTTLEVAQLPQIKGFETDLRLLFQNLISNAIKFRKPEALPIVSVFAEQVDESWRFAVKDNGIGIAEKHKNRVFEIFQRLYDRNQYEGTGIGLAHCQKIVELHGGKIWVDSEFGKGSTFYFTIPN